MVTYSKAMVKETPLQNIKIHCLKIKYIHSLCTKLQKKNKGKRRVLYNTTERRQIKTNSKIY